MFADGKNYLITTDSWFIAPNGEYYNGAFGPGKIVDAEALLGIRSNARSVELVCRRRIRKSVGLYCRVSDSRGRQN